MRIKYIVTILFVSLVLSGCGDKKQVTLPSLRLGGPANDDVISKEQEDNKKENTENLELITENWKVYQNEELGIEFTYPTGWHYKKDEDKTKQELYLGFAPDEKILEQGDPYPIEFIAVALDVKMTFE